MGTRGRKSSTELTAPGAVALIERPDAPLDLTPEQAEVWQEIVDEMPADWFSRENYPLLAQYCRHVVNARRLAQLIDQECAREDLDPKNYADLLAAEHKQTSALKALAASMRLAQQARYQARGAERTKGGTGRRPPWRSD